MFFVKKKKKKKKKKLVLRNFSRKVSGILLSPTLSAGAVEYLDCTSAER